MSGLTRDSGAGSLPGRVKQLVAVYKDSDHDRYLNNLFQLQIVAGDYNEAVRTISALRDLRRASNAAQAAARLAPFEIYAKAETRVHSRGSEYLGGRPPPASQVSFGIHRFEEVWRHLDGTTLPQSDFWTGIVQFLL